MAAAFAQVLPQRTCFIITPFKGFDDLTNLIKLAAGDPSISVQAIRNDDLALGRPFPDTIFDQIQAATLVAAVCSPDPETGQTNRNVELELGLALASHKPTLILTTDPSTLPSDVRHLTYMKYSVDDLRDPKGFQGKLTLEMNKILRQPVPDVTPIVPKVPAKAVVNEEFWDRFRIVVKSTGEAIKVLTELGTVVADLSERSFGLLKGDEVVTYLQTAARLHRLNKGDAATDKLKSCCAIWDAKYNKLSSRGSSNVMTHLVAVKSQVDVFPSLCHQVRDANLELGKQITQENRQLVYTVLLQLRSAVESLDDELHNLLFSMLEEIP